MSKGVLAKGNWELVAEAAEAGPGEGAGDRHAAAGPGAPPARVSQAAGRVSRASLRRPRDSPPRPPAPPGRSASPSRASIPAPRRTCGQATSSVACDPPGGVHLLGVDQQRAGERLGARAGGANAPSRARPLPAAPRPARGSGPTSARARATRRLRGAPARDARAPASPWPRGAGRRALPSILQRARHLEDALAGRVTPPGAHGWASGHQRSQARPPRVVQKEQAGSLQEVHGLLDR